MSTIAGQPITHCPVCRYDLAGLPKNHRCPECGFEYDETTRIWMGRSMSVWYFVIASAYTLLAVANGVGMLSGSGRLGSLTFANLVAYTCFAVAWLIVFRYRRARTFTSLSSRVIAYKTPFRSVCQIPWSEIRFSEAFERPMQRVGDDWKFLRLPLAHLRQADRESLLAAIRGRSKDQQSARSALVSPEPSTTVEHAQ